MTTLTPAPPEGRPAQRAGDLTGTATLLRLWLRRDRIMIPIWLYGLAAYAYVNAAATKKLYPTLAQRQQFAAGAGDNKGTVAIYGPSADLHTLGGLGVWKLGATASVLASILAVLLVVRHSRAEEESGRLELVGSAVVGRRAPLTSALLTAALTAVLLGVLITAGLWAGGLPPGGSAAFGASIAAASWVFAAAAAVCAQLSESSRTANMTAFAVLGVAYLLRVVGDASGNGRISSWPTWLSPLGWSELIRPYGPCRWWLLIVPLVFGALLAGTAYVLTGRRDLGAGLIPARPGPAEAAAGLRSPYALAWRLQRGTLLAWAAGTALYSVVIGSLVTNIGDLFNGNAQTRKLFTELGGHTDLVNAFLSAILSLMGLLTAVYTVQALLRLRGEEGAQRLEPLLATPTTRVRWAAGHLAVAFAGGVLLLTLAGTGIGLVHGLRSGDLGGQLPRILGASLAQLPAVWVIAGITVLVFGLAPGLANLSWAAVVTCLLLNEFGPLLKLPQWVMDINPYTHIPRLPGAAFTLTPLAVLTAVAALLTAAGLETFRRRDLH